MAQEIELPNGQIAEFPDSMSLDEIKGVLQKKFPKKGFIERAGETAGKFNKFVESTGLPAFSGGLYQGVGDIGASLGNLIAKPLGKEISHPEFRRFFPDTMGNSLAFGAGQIAAQIPAYASGGAAIGSITGIGKGAGLSGKVAQGALAGGLMGESQEGGRGEGVLLGGGAPIAGKIISGLRDLRSSKIVNNVLKAEKEISGQYGKQFNFIIKEGEASGANKYLSPTSYNKKILEKGGDKDLLHGLYKYNTNPTVANAHDAQSDLLKYAAKIGTPKGSLAREAKSEAKKLSGNIRLELSRALQKAGRTDLSADYSMTRQGYKNDVVPYLNSKTLNALKNKDIRKGKAASSLANEEKFMAKIGQYKHPEIARRELVKNILTSSHFIHALGLGAGSALGMYGAAKLLEK
jgi:hypothetical protein